MSDLTEAEQKVYDYLREHGPQGSEEIENATGYDWQTLDLLQRKRGLIDYCSPMGWFIVQRAEEPRVQQGRRAETDAAPLQVSDGAGGGFGFDPDDPDNPFVVFETPEGESVFAVHFRDGVARLASWDSEGIWHWYDSIDVPAAIRRAREGAAK